MILECRKNVIVYLSSRRHPLWLILIISTTLPESARKLSILWCFPLVWEKLIRLGLFVVGVCVLGDLLLWLTARGPSKQLDHSRRVHDTFEREPGHHLTSKCHLHQPLALHFVNSVGFGIEFWLYICFRSSPILILFDSVLLISLVGETH